LEAEELKEFRVIGVFVKSITYLVSSSKTLEKQDARAKKQDSIKYQVVSIKTQDCTKYQVPTAAGRQSTKKQEPRAKKLDLSQIGIDYNFFAPRNSAGQVLAPLREEKKKKE